MGSITGKLSKVEHSAVEMTAVTREKANALVFGYIRQECKLGNIVIPDALIELFVEWFYQKIQLLKFSRKYSNAQRFVFENDDTKITKKSSGHSYMLVDMEPLFEGAHCFRVQVILYNMDNHQIFA